MAINHTIAQSAEALRQVRASGSELDVNRFLCALERHYGSDHMRAAHKLAGELAEQRHAAERAAERAAAQPEQPAAYRLAGRDVAYWTGSMYRFYCTLAAWPYSPAARAGETLADTDQLGAASIDDVIAAYRA